MSLFVKARNFLRNIFSTHHVDSDLDQEVRSHLDMLTDENLRAGMAPAEAQRAARIELGGIEQVKEQVREQRLGHWLSSVLADCRFALRQLRKSPGFTAVAILTLALGIGANTAIFSVVNAVLLRALPFPAPKELVRVVSVRIRENAPDNASYPDFADWQAQSHVFSEMAAFHTDRFTLTGRGEAVHVEGAVVSADLFSLLGVRPILGRAFLPEEERIATNNGGFAVILSHALWTQRFAADPGIIGRIIQLDDRSFTVVGIMPAGFQFPIQGQPIEFWTTIAVDFVSVPGEPAMAAQRGAHYLDVIARLKPQVSPAQAQAELSTIVSALNKQYPEHSPRTVWIVPELDQLVSGIRLSLLILSAAVGCVLLIACANVGNLLLSRGASREREFAIRRALGADRRRVVRQLLTESVLLALFGGMLGTLLAFWTLHPLLRMVPEDVPRMTNVHLDYSILFFTAAISVLTGVLFGLVPAIRSSASKFAESLQAGGRGSSEGFQRTRLRSLLVVSNMAVASVLLVGAGLLIKSFQRLQQIDPGYSPRGVLTFKVDLPYLHYPADRQALFFQQSLERIRQVPGVRSASAVLPLPLNGDEVETSFEVEGHPVPQAAQPRTNYSWVEPGYFQTLGIHLRVGRDFTERDELHAIPVAIINDTLAKQYFANGDAIGKRIRPQIGNGFSEPPLREIVGVVADIRQNGLTAPPEPQVYVPRAQSPIGSMIFVVRSEAFPSTVFPAVRAQLTAMDKDLPIYSAKTLDEYTAESVGEQRFLSILASFFAALALLLASVGLYGVISYSATQRTREIGVRLALGATRQDVLRLVVGQGFKLVLLGAALGTFGAFLLTRFLSSLLFEVTPTDPATFIVVSLALSLVALLASYIPARRASRVDPMVALRYE